MGVVHLKEGPNILSQILTNDLEKLHVGMPLTLMWDRAEEWATRLSILLGLLHRVPSVL